jgi:hypothetical protein
LDRQRDWPTYNQSLIERGALDRFFTPQVLTNWVCPPPAWRRRGRRHVYTDLAILVCLCVAKASGDLSLRQTQGTVRAWMDAHGHHLMPVPNYTSLARRAQQLDVDLAVDGFPEQQHPVTAIDSTGLSISGQGAWRDQKYGGQPNRRSWVKAHYATCPTTGEIVGCVLTPENVSDCVVAPALIEATFDRFGSVHEVLGDGAYDTRELVQVAARYGAKMITPPPVTAVLELGPTTRQKYDLCRALPTDRNARIQSRTHTGDDQAWKLLEQYHRRSLAETTNSRYVAAFSDRLRQKRYDTQTTMVRVALRVLNLWRANEIRLAGGYTSFQAR